MKHLLVVGAGFSGAVLARALAEAGMNVRVIDVRGHFGGNCHTQRDAETGVMTHLHGPHVFHTGNEKVWRYLQRFGKWIPYVNRVKANTGDGVYSLPINLHTINQFYGQTLTPDEARVFLESKAERGIGEPRNFEEQALRMIGRSLYETFFRGYTIKQWGCDPTALPPELLQRLPVRFDYNDNYYNSRYQAMPRDGYTRVIESILDHPGIRVDLDTPWDRAMLNGAAHVFYSGALDQFYDYHEGRLGYRTVHWQRETYVGDYQGNAVINHTRLDVPWTRVIEHKHFTPWETHDRTLVYREFSRETAAGDVPYYPKRLAADLPILKRYVELAGRESKVSFLGRLGTYRYLDMHQVIDDALDFAQAFMDARGRGQPVPVFSRPPL